MIIERIYNLKRILQIFPEYSKTREHSLNRYDKFRQDIIDFLRSQRIEFVSISRHEANEIKVCFDIDYEQEFEKKINDAILLFEKDEYAKAKVVLLHLKGKFPIFSQVYRLLARIEYVEDNISETVKYCDLAIKIDPNDEKNIILKGNIMLFESLKTGSYIFREEAIKLYKLAIEANPNSFAAIFNLNNAIGNSGEIEDLFDKRPNEDLRFYVSKALCNFRKGFKTIDHKGNNNLLVPFYSNHYKDAFDTLHEGIMKNYATDKNNPLYLNAIRILMNIGRSESFNRFFSLQSFFCENDYLASIREIILNMTKGFKDINGIQISLKANSEDLKFLIELQNLSENIEKKGCLKHGDDFWLIKLIRIFLKVRVYNAGLYAKHLVINKEKKKNFHNVYSENYKNFSKSKISTKKLNTINIVNEIVSSMDVSSIKKISESLKSSFVISNDQIDTILDIFNSRIEGNHIGRNACSNLSHEEILEFLKVVLNDDSDTTISISKILKVTRSKPKKVLEYLQYQSIVR